MDAAFFGGSPFSDALALAKNHALDAPQSLRLSDYYNEDAIRMFLAVAATLGATVNGRDTIDLGFLANRFENVKH